MDHRRDIYNKIMDILEQEEQYQQLDQYDPQMVFLAYKCYKNSQRQSCAHK